MTAPQQSVLVLMKNAVTGQKPPLPEGFKLRPAAISMFKQGLGAMCYIAAKNYELAQGTPLLTFLEEQYYLTSVHSMQQMEQIDLICKAFDANSIDYMPVKGSITKGLYPDPAMRTMSDADILIRQEEYDRIVPVMESLNFRSVGESNHEYIWENDNLTVELHKRLIPSYNKDYYSYFGEGWDLAKVNVGGSRWAMTHEDAFIFDTIHFAKHYRDGKVNAHFLIDLWIQMRSFPDLDHSYIRNQMARLRMESFYDNILRVISAWFEDGQWDEKVERITAVLFNDNFEEAENHALVAKSARAAQEAGSASKAKQAILLHKVFPTKEQMCCFYPKWKKIPLPIAWVMRWFYLLFCRRDTVVREVAKVNQVSPQDIENYRKDLEYVGLEFSDQVVLPE